MKAEQILEKYAKNNMVEWNQESFKHSHPKLYKSIIEAINEALILPVVVKSLPTKDDALNKIGDMLFDDEIDYANFMKNDKHTGFYTGFLECYKWLTD